MSRTLANRRWPAQAAFAALFGFVSCGAIFPASAASDSETAAAAARPAAEGVPEVAVARLIEMVKTAANDDAWRSAAAHLVPALIAADRAPEAQTLLNDPRLKNSSLSNFWRGQAFAAMHQWHNALPFFQAAARGPSSSVRADAMFGAAEMLRALGRPEEALQILNTLQNDKVWATRARLRAAELLLDRSDWVNAQHLLDDMNATSAGERKERRFLRGRLELVRHRPEHATGTFESLIKKPDGASHSLVIAALFGMADAHLQMKTPETGDDFLEDFIDRQPNDANLPELFAKLDELYRAERKPARVELEKWTREPEQPRRAFAQWYRARIELRAGHRDRAVQILGDLRKGLTKVPGLAPAFLDLAKLSADDGRIDDALVILEEARATNPDAPILDRINLLAGELNYLSNRYEAASAKFEEAARPGSSLASVSKFNASLSWLQLGNHTSFLVAYNELAKSDPAGDDRAELRFAQGLVEAGKGDKAAADSLQKFVREFPQHPRVSEAWVALAELAFHATPPRIDEARKDLQRAAELKPTELAAEHADYLAIWLEEATPENEAKVIDQANRFLARHPASHFVSEVRMKLAETYYRRQDFANAETHFETLAEQNPSGPVAEKALFFAAESAMSTMGARSVDRAIVLFDRVVQMKGDLRWAARNEQAVIERKLGKPKDALLLYDEVLKSDAKAGEKREALCGKGDIYFELGSEDSKNFDAAIAIYEQLAAESPQPGHWRNQALFKKGVCLEKKADRDAALTVFYKVLEEETRPDRSPEFFWFYKAGFNAARLLEDSSRWESAASIYEKLVAAGGSRSEEAQARLNRLRLEHFLWGN
jgi:tetratricopeptide (TPR) repeat protein